MTELPKTQNRVQEFKQEIADMRVRDPATGRDRLWLRMGVGFMVAGLILAVVAFFVSSGANDSRDQTDALVAALGGIALTIVGAALFLRFSIAGFLRFWLARLSYEQQMQTDRIVDELRD